MKIKSFAKKAVCVAIISSLSALAQAATFFEGEAFNATGPNNAIATAQNLGTLNLSGIVVVGSRLDAFPGTDSADFFKFVVSASTQVQLAVATPLGPTFLNDPVLGLYNTGGSQIAYNDDYPNQDISYDSFLSRYLTAGTYYAAVSGFDDKTFVGGGDKNWLYTLSITPVPEPESYAMFLAGLGLMGLIVRRRMHSQS